MRQDHGFTIVELLVVVAIIGLLVALLLPAVNSARASARSAHCKNNLRQLGLAAIQYEGTKRHFPPARIQPRPGQDNRQCGGEGVSWVVHALPYMEETAFANGWDLHGDFASHAEELRQRPLGLLVCPERRSVIDAVQKVQAMPTTTRFFSSAQQPTSAFALAAANEILRCG